MNKNIFLILVLLIILCFSTFGCVTHNIWNPPKVEELNPMEIFGTEGAPLEGRLFRSICESNAYGNATTAKNTAITNAANKSNELGFPYFTIIWDSVDQNLKAGTYDTIQTSGRGRTSVLTQQYAYTFHLYECIFIILKKDELEGWDNIYTVSNYIK